jgi:hypothetical protein
MFAYALVHAQRPGESPDATGRPWQALFESDRFYGVENVAEVSQATINLSVVPAVNATKEVRADCNVSTSKVLSNWQYLVVVYSLVQIQLTSLTKSVGTCTLAGGSGRARDSEPRQ